MISALQLLWIVPVSILVGAAACIMLICIINSREDEEVC